MSAPAAETQGSGSSLVDRLSKILPQGHDFGICHVSTPPTKTEALFSAPPGERDDKTYCENHFLGVTIDAPSPTSANTTTATTTGSVLVFAIEIFIFTTAYSTTFFVSKADSTGYLILLNLPSGTPSPIREVCTTFLSYLIESRKRKNVQSVVNLFARAQDQYLFPGSIKNKTKHVLDDRGLVKWWCRVLHPLFQSPSDGGMREAMKGYLVVPGLDNYETRAFLPRAPDAASHWVLGHPLEKVSHYTREYDWVPPRCLIPRFPDDPKSRYRDELDDEGHKSKFLQTTGMWKSIRSLDQFWEMMAFRQECSSGRMTGFIWVVIDPEDQVGHDDASTANPAPAPIRPSTPPNAQAAPTVHYSTPRKLKPTSSNAEIEKINGEKNKKRKKQLTGPIKPRQPTIKTQQRNHQQDRPKTTAYYHWPLEARGQRILSESDYKRAVELLLHLEFGTLELAKGSTKRWVGEVGMGEKWVLEVCGSREPPSADAPSTTTSTGAVNNLSGLVKRKRAPGPVEGGSQLDNVNVLSVGLVRKKPKDSETGSEPAPAETTAPAVNMLGAGLVRKKPQA